MTQALKLIRRLEEAQKTCHAAFDFKLFNTLVRKRPSISQNSVISAMVPLRGP